MADFVEVAKINDLADGKMKRFMIGDKDILLARVEGKYYATQGRCPHMQGYLSRGTLKGTIVTCPMHGSQFDMKTGKVVRWVEGKGFMSIIGKLMSIFGIASKKQIPLAVYETRIDGDRVMVKVG
jgi:3-phenylpropionate/trans-cinnamate dioxygenase ferredoxin subunit